MKNVNKILAILITVGLLAGCSGSKKDDIKEIGIIQIVEHGSLDEARKGFIEELEAHGYKDGVNIKIDYKNAQGDMNTLNTIAKDFVTQGKDLIYAIATPSAQAAANATKDIPIVFTAVTDPVEAKLVSSLEKPGANVTGTIDEIDINKQFTLLTTLKPDVKKIGIIYNTSEINSQIQVDQAKAAAKAMNLEIVTKGVTSSNEISLAAETLVKEVDALYVPSDNLVTAALPVVIPIATAANIPVMGGVMDHVTQGALANDGIDYKALGKQTAQMAIKLLEGEKPANLPVESLKDTKLIINKKTANALNITIDASLLEKATIVE